MLRESSIVAVLLTALATPLAAQVADFKPVTREMLANPSPDDWLMLNRTYDEQRFSPLSAINRDNVGQLGLAWARGLPAGTNETIPIVHQGVMYVVSPGAAVLALDATSGDLIWEYSRDYPKEMIDFIGAPTAARQKSLAIFEDMIFFETPEGFLVALDARTGKPRCRKR
jgi:alcohol dehydrogenase (cytochrome c)